MLKIKEKISRIIKIVKSNKRISSKTRYLLGVLFVIIILYFIKGLFVVAVVNNYPILRISIIKELEKQGGSQVMETIINERLIVQEAAMKNIKVTKDDIDKEVLQIEKNLKLQGTDLETALSMQGQTKDDLIKAISLKLLIEKTLKDRIVINDEEIKTYFDSNKATLYKGKTLEEIKSEISTTLGQQKLSAEYQKWIVEIKANAKILKFVDFGAETSK